MDRPFQVKLSDSMQKFLGFQGSRNPAVRIAFRKGLRTVQQHARQHHRFKTRTGMLERAIDTRITSDYPLTGEVYINPDMAPYGVYQHEGTKPHFVKPVNKQALRWSKGDKFFFSKGHMNPGIPGEPFLEKALHRTADRTQALVRDAVFQELLGDK